MQSGLLLTRLPAPGTSPNPPTQEAAQDFPRLVEQLSGLKYSKTLRMAGTGLHGAAGVWCGVAACRCAPTSLACALCLLQRCACSRGLEEEEGMRRTCTSRTCSCFVPFHSFPAVEGLQRFIPAGSQFLMLNGLVYNTREFNLYSFLDALRREVRCVVPCCAVLHRAVLCCAVLCCTAPCRAVLCCAASWCAMLLGSCHTGHARWCLRNAAYTHA